MNSIQYRETEAHARPEKENATAAGRGENAEQRELEQYITAYVAAGFIPIQVRENSKVPAEKGWPKAKAGDALTRFAGHSGNIGVTFPDWLFALDVDCKDGAPGEDSLLALEMAHGTLPATLEQRTPSGGRHLIFRKPPLIGFRNTVGVLGNGLDIRATGGQIVAEPSTIDGKDYAWLDWDMLAGEAPAIADAPQWLIDLLSEQSRPPGGAALAEGSRNNQLFRRACAMRGKGMDLAEIQDDLIEINKACSPPLPLQEVAKIAASAARYPAGEPDEDDMLPFGSDQALADDFAIKARDALRWTPGMDWMVNRGSHWERDELLHRSTVAREVCKSAAAGINDEKLRRKICAASTASAAIALARRSPVISTPVAEWDKHPMLLNTPDSVIDLHTGQTVARDSLLFTQVTRASPAAMPTPVWDRFLGEIFANDLEMVEFIQRMAGYCLTGSIKEQKLFFLHGAGANGKSVFLDVLRSIAGTYAHNLPSEALMTAKHEGHPTMFASLQGRRLAISSEIEDGAHWAESRIKSLTGDETLTARYIRQDFFTFPVTHKHVIAGNFKPRLKGDDFAMARRLVLVPFTQRFEGARCDKALPDKLRAEYPGVLKWAVEGARKWAAGGLEIPAAVLEASRDYMTEMNDIEQWIEECCTRDPQATTAAAALYASFSAWKERGGERPPSNKAFSQRLERMFTKQRTRAARVFVGLSLISPGGGYEAASRGW